MDNFKLKQLNVGFPDGESESQSELFNRLFFNANNIYEEFFENRIKFMIIGNKGMGKTYFARYIAQKNETYEVLSARNFLLAYLSNLDNFVDETSYKYALCKWFLLEQLSKQIAKLHPVKAKLFLGSPIYRIKKMLEEDNNIDPYKPIKRTLESGTEYETKGALGGSTGKDMNLSISGSDKKSKKKTVHIEEIRKIFYEKVETMEKLLINATSDKDDFVIFLDDLDEIDGYIGRDKGNNDILINLIKCTKELNASFNLKRKKIRIVLLMRDDILEKLQFCDPNLGKIKSSNGIELYWLVQNHTSPENHPLMKMIIHKAKATCPALFDLSDAAVYSFLFPEQIDNKDPLSYLLDNSFGRPRDFVAYLACVIKQNPYLPAFTATALKDARVEYSGIFYDDLVNQGVFHKESEYIFQCYQLLSGLRKKSFYYSEIQQHFEQNKSRYPKIDNTKECLEFLYSQGAIGNLWRVGNKNSNNWYSSWSYRKDSLANIDFEKKISIHFALRKKFSL
ncbi:hypothetical protein [Anaerotignum sp.]|uniref:P-loop ATPase, Sll1717 family n=1 Tax=Anaerotignum sp. TaxID=2039241 RepID=UPI00331C824D